MVHLNDHLFDQYADNVVEEVNVKEALKLSISVVQKAAAPKNGVKFSQGSNGTIRSILAMSYDVWQRCTMSPAFDQVFSDKQTNRESTYCKNKDNITITIDISQYQSLVYQVSKAKNTVRKSILLHWLQTWTQFFLVLNAYTGECSSITSPYFGGKGDPNQNACTADTFGGGGI